MNKLTFDEVRKINRQRSINWHAADIDSWSVSDWAVGMAGEAGEVCDAVKKLNRFRDNIQRKECSEQELIENIALEIADTYLYLDLLAQRIGINIEDYITKKFNMVSEKYGFQERIVNGS